MVHTGANDDKELMAIDNNPASPYYGRMVVAWINFNDGTNLLDLFDQRRHDLVGAGGA